jgi:fructokinase
VLDPVHIVAIGEILWDVFGEDEYLGGAPFNFAAHAACLGAHVDLVSAVAVDDRGRRALAAAQKLGVTTELTTTVDTPPTGSVTVAIDAAGQPDYTIHRPAAYDAVSISETALKQLAISPPDWIYFGTLLNTDPRALATTRRLLDALPETSRFYDVNLRKDSYSRELLAILLPLATVLKVNADEATELQRLFGDPVTSSPAFARQYAARYGYKGVCVTQGAEGSFVFWQGKGHTAAGHVTTVTDAVGAGDAFAAALVHGLSNDWPIEKTADFANRVGALIAARQGAVPRWTVDEAWAL